jgi:uncharacterized membrane protein
MILARIGLSRRPDYAFLVWNLALAWVPLILAVAFWLGYRWRWPRLVLGIVGVLWLLFLPNGPYILTDFVHLRFGYDGMPRWFDALAIAAYAWTGLLLGFASLYLMQTVAASLFGPRLTWSFVVGALGLSSVGIYLGRYQRLNSWDALRHPATILDMIRVRLGDPLGNETLLAIVVVFSLFLVISYLAIYAIILPRLALERFSRAGGASAAERGAR